MFTGLVETVGKVVRTAARGNYRILSIASSINTREIELGESIACDGACLTVVEIGSDSFVVEVSQETMAKTTLADYRTGSPVNLERALKAGGRFGGHFVNGHVDHVGTVDYSKPVGESLELALRFDSAYDQLVVDKGALAVNGVSLTINTCLSGWCSVNLIPYTVQSTNLGRLRTGDRVNLEFDLIGKYVAKMPGKENKQELTIERFTESGW